MQDNRSKTLQTTTWDVDLLPCLEMILAAALLVILLALLSLPASAEAHIPRPEIAVSATGSQTALMVVVLKSRALRGAHTLEIARQSQSGNYQTIQRVSNPACRTRLQDAPAYDGRYRYRARVITASGISHWSRAAAVSLAPSRNVPPQTPLAQGQRPCPQGTIGEVLRLVNEARGDLPPLKLQRQLQWAARTHTIEMAASGNFSHDGWLDFIRNSGFRGSATGENIAYGYGGAAAVMQAWLNSPGHRANILNPSSRFIGIGCVQAGWPWWTQDFGR